METLSTSVSTLQIHSLNPSTTHHQQQLINLFLPTHHHLPHFSTKPNPISTKTSPPFTTTKTLIHSSTSPNSNSPSPKPHSPILHTKPSTGYAAALLDVARCNSNLEPIQKDVKRLSKLLKHKDVRAIIINPFTKDTIKCRIVKEILEMGRFQKELMVVVKILIEKNKIGMVCEVLDEFERIYDQLNGTQVVMVSSRKKMEEDQLLGIAKKVQKMSGAVKVKK